MKGHSENPGRQTNEWIYGLQKRGAGTFSFWRENFLLPTPERKSSRATFSENSDPNRSIFGLAISLPIKFEGPLLHPLRKKKIG